ncbi:hypothetical protein [Rhodopseudomonas pseudopalustris]|uniref:DNA-directed RNA polymerase n=1 Tax=Rhodopseudomonas pseudopalustris TaxID=1513892 RepID=A0A1H8NCD2_9BRAD|nr:hypothetical protein [Rhodopseudomonas pseudopalustris]SEO27168.1 DNA-directed RNA polymerase [Rhodopseudomonas pseudopalustris]
MNDKKFKYNPFVTEVMTAREVHLTEPDTEGEYADGKYKTEATACKEYTERLKAEIQAVADTHFARKKNVHLPWWKTKEGVIAFKFKSPRKQPKLTDAKGRLLNAGTVIRGGTQLRIAGVIAAWEKGEKRGVSLFPDAVRVIKLSEDFDPCAAFGPPEDGFDGSARARNDDGTRSRQAPRDP